MTVSTELEVIFQRGTAAPEIQRPYVLKIHHQRQHACKSETAATMTRRDAPCATETELDGDELAGSIFTKIVWKVLARYARFSSNSVNRATNLSVRT